MKKNRKLYLNCDYRECRKPLSDAKLRRHARFCDRLCASREYRAIKLDRKAAYHDECHKDALGWLINNEDLEFEILVKCRNYYYYSMIPVVNSLRVKYKQNIHIPNNITPALARIFNEKYGTNFKTVGDW